MSDARADIFARLRPTLDAGMPLEARRVAAAARVALPLRGPVPVRVQNVDLVETFCTRAHEVGATTARVATIAELGEAVAVYLRERNLPQTAKASPELADWNLTWPATLAVTHGGTVGDDPVGIAAARAGIAETGTLMLASGLKSPTKLNFLPETHIVVLCANRIVGTYEQAWDCLRKNLEGPLLPRTVNWITGPSRTADIEQTLLVGVHGPKRIHIVIVDEEPATPTSSVA